MDGSEQAVEDAVLGLALSALSDRGMTAEALRAEAGYGLIDTEGRIRLELVTLTERLRSLDPVEWPGVVSEWAGQVVRTVQDPSRRSPVPEDEARRQLRTTLIPDEGDERYGYARPFAPGLLTVLALDKPDAVWRLFTDTLHRLPFPVDELFAIGQDNTDLEPVVERFPLRDGVWGLGGHSHFVASRALRMRSLVDEVIGPAPLGIAFGTINRGLLLYSLVTQEHWRSEVLALAQSVDAYASDTGYPHPGGLLSGHSYYWASDGRVELLVHRAARPGQASELSLRPGSAFLERVAG